MISIICASTGALVVLFYWGLSLTGVGNIGQQTDIGGGVLVLVGSALILGGAVLFLAGVLVERSRRKD